MLATLATVIASGGTLGQAAPRADALQSLGDAFRAYDAGDLASAAASLAKIHGKLVVHDYELWLTGMVALRTGEPGSLAS